MPAFAPTVLTTIPPDVDRYDAFSTHDLVEIRAREDLAWEPASTAVSRTLYEMAKDAVFPQDVWCLELTFKPLRMIEVDVPQSDGSVARKLVWYMVYRVRNTGAGLEAQVGDNGEFKTSQQAEEEIRFIPHFVLSVRDRAMDPDDAEVRVRKAYLDRVIPAALEPIQQREFSGRNLLTSAEVAQQLLVADEDGQGLWGVAMWEDIDPRTDFLSVYVYGLTNAYQWEDSPEQVTPDSPLGRGRTFARKALQLNFWRPGDEYDENEREIRFGVPQGKAEFYESGEGVAYRWVFR